MTKKLEELDGWEVFKTEKDEKLYTIGRIFREKVALIVVEANENGTYSVTMAEAPFKLALNEEVSIIDGAIVF